MTYCDGTVVTYDLGPLPCLYFHRDELMVSGPAVQLVLPKVAAFSFLPTESRREDW